MISMGIAQSRTAKGKLSVSPCWHSIEEQSIGMAKVAGLRR